MESKSKGELTEMLFMVAATKQGFIVSKPFGDNQRYDFIIDGGEGLHRVQVKATYIKDQHATRGDRYRINASFGASHKKSYSNKEIDILAVYIAPEEVWYIIPVREIENRKTFGFRPHLKSKGRLEKYKESWEWPKIW